MYLASLRYFAEIAKCGSFSLAAKHVFISQQGLSRAIGNLERELGVKLFSRSEKGVALTPAGKQLLPLAESINGQCQELMAVAEKHRRALDKLSDDHVTVFMVPYFTVVLLDYLESRFSLSTVGNVSFVEKELDEVIRAVAVPPGGIGLVSVLHDYLHLFADEPTVVFEPLFANELMVKGSRKLLSPKKKSIGKRELADYPLAFHKNLELDRLLNTVLLPNVDYDVVGNYANLGLIEKQVARGEAITVESSFNAYLTMGDDDLVRIPVRDTELTYIGFAYPRGEALGDAMGRCLEQIRELMIASFQPYIKRHPAPSREQLGLL